LRWSVTRATASVKALPLAMRSNYVTGVTLPDRAHRLSGPERCDWCRRARRGHRSHRHSPPRHPHRDLPHPRPGLRLVVDVSTIGYLTGAYAATLLWWHLAAAARALRQAAPDHPLTRWLAKG